MQRSVVPEAPIERSDLPYREAYTVPEIAELLGGASERWVWSLVHDGSLPSIKIGGKRLVTRTDLLAFVESLRLDEQRARNAATGMSSGNNTQGTGGAGSGSGSGGSGGTNTGGSGGTRPTKAAA